MGSFSFVFEGPRDNPHRWVDLASTKEYEVHIMKAVYSNEGYTRKVRAMKARQKRLSKKPSSDMKKT